MRNRNTGIETARAEQIDVLSSVEIGGAPILIVGSLGHAAVRGVELPPAIKKGGSIRDIDIYLPSQSNKFSIESTLCNLGMDTPAPLDAGANNLLRREANGVYATRGDVSVELRGAALLDEITEYPIDGMEDMRLRSLSPLGMLALHNLEPTKRIFLHRDADKKFTAWFEEQDLVLPKELNESIAEFHRAYHEKYPHAAILRHLSKAYIHLVPESVRRVTRPLTHPFMRKYAGRRTPVTEGRDSEQ